MSFYGNSYHYTAESFARVVLLNKGLGRYLTIPETGFTEVSDTEALHLDAIVREEGLGIQSGNHWIKLAYDGGDTFQILHNGPGPRESDTGLVVPFEIAPVAEVPAGAVQNNKVIKFNDYFRIPTISYDAAGHITTAEQAVYYRMPENPTKPLEERMQLIDGKNAQGQTQEPPNGTSLKKQLLDEMDDIYDRMKEIDGVDKDGNLDAEYNSVKKQLITLVNELNDKLSNLNTAVDNSNTALTTANGAAANASVAVNACAGLDARITALEEKIK